jgi:hypothetical protein
LRLRVVVTDWSQMVAETTFAFLDDIESDVGALSVEDRAFREVANQAGALGHQTRLDPLEPPQRSASIHERVCEEPDSIEDRSPGCLISLPGPMGKGG